MLKPQKLIILAMAATIFIQSAGAVSTFPQTNAIIVSLEHDGILSPIDSSLYIAEDIATNLDAIVSLHKAFKDSAQLPKNVQESDIKKLDWLDSRWYNNTGESLTLETACQFILAVKDLPFLEPSLYDVDTPSKAIFSAYVYGYINEISNWDTEVTKEMLYNMVYQAKYVNPDPHISDPLHTSGLEIVTKDLKGSEKVQRIQEAEAALLKIPEAIRTDIANRGYHITLMSTKAYREYWLNMYRNETTSIACYSLDKHHILSTDSLDRTFMHEIGHHLLFWYGNEEEFNPICKANIDTVCKLIHREYGRTNLQEGFADSFVLYLKTPDKLKEQAPDLYQYIDNLVEKMMKFQPASDGEGEG